MRLITKLESLEIIENDLLALHKRERPKLIAALQAAERMAEVLQQWSESVNSEDEETEEVLAAWKDATE